MGTFSIQSSPVAFFKDLSGMFGTDVFGKSGCRKNPVQSIHLDHDTCRQHWLGISSSKKRQKTKRAHHHATRSPNERQPRYDSKVRNESNGTELLASCATKSLNQPCSREIDLLGGMLQVPSSIRIHCGHAHHKPSRAKKITSIEGLYLPLRLPTKYSQTYPNKPLQNTNFTDLR